MALSWSDDLAKTKNRFAEVMPGAAAIFRDPDIHFHAAYFELAEDEALVVEVRPPRCDYWMFVLSNHWLETLDYTRHRITLNHHTAKLEPDGSLQLIVAARDPGHPNWLDTRRARARHARRALGRTRRRGRDAEHACGASLTRAGFAALLALLLALGRADAKPVVILLSLDGVRHDYLDRDPLPAFDRIAREGARAEALVPIFPSTTFPNHVALATGTHADRHGIVGNTFDDEKLGSFHYRKNGGDAARFLDAEPLWVAAERQGVPAATFFWVGSEADWRGRRATDRKTPFDSKIGEAAKVAQILAWLDRPEPERPGLVMAWWHGADHAGHQHGPDAKETRDALRAQDRQLAKLLAGLDQRKAWGEVTLLLVSDHGMTTYEKTVDVRAVLREAGVPTRRVIQGVASAQVHLKDPAQAARAVEVLRALPGVEAWARGDVPERLRYGHPRAGDVVVLAAPPLALLPAKDRGARFGGIARFFGRSLGAHGYDPGRYQEMHGIFVAIGRGVPKGARLPRVSAIDVAPTVARLLGIEAPAQSEGRPIAGLTPSKSQSPPPSPAR